MIERLEDKVSDFDEKNLRLNVEVTQARDKIKMMQNNIDTYNNTITELE